MLGEVLLKLLLGYVKEVYEYNCSPDPLWIVFMKMGYQGYLILFIWVFPSILAIRFIHLLYLAYNPKDSMPVVPRQQISLFTNFLYILNLYFLMQSQIYGILTIKEFS